MQDRFIRLSVSLARLQKVIQRIKTSGMGRIALKAGHTLVLCQLAAAPEGGHFSDLTERCDLDPAMISRVLADLVRSGLVEKCGAPGKYNALYLLTDAGRDRAARVTAVVRDVERRADEGIDPADLATFYKVLNQLTKNLEAVAADRRRRLNRWKDKTATTAYRQKCPTAPKRSRALVLFILGGYTCHNKLM